jgi:Flp pilus assembly pilin Flp
MAEYAVILAFVVIAGVVAYQLLGPPIAGLYQQVVTTFS